MDKFLIIHVFTLSFTVFSIILLIYLYKLYKKGFIKILLNILSLMIYAYASGIGFYILNEYYKGYEILQKPFLLFQVVIISSILFNLFLFIHKFTKLDLRGKERFVYYTVFTPVVVEVIGLVLKSNLSIITLNIFYLHYIYSAYILFKFKLNGGDTPLWGLKRDFVKWYKIIFCVTLPIIILSDILTILRGIGIQVFWEPIFFLFFSVSTLFFSLRYIILISKEPTDSTNVISIDGFIEKYDISDREGEVLKLLLENKKYRDISDELCISMPTVKTHVSRIYKKCSVSGKGELRAKFLNHT